METRKIGTFQATRIGLGMAALGRPGYISLDHASDLPHTSETAMRDHAATVLDAAWDAGIRYFDAARSYGKAESFVRSWLDARSIQPGAVAVGSKWGYTYTADWQIDADTHEVKEHSLDVLQRQWAETQENLGSYLNLYQIHSATLATGVLENEAVLGELWRLKDAGTAVGLTLSGPEQARTLREALEVKREGVLLFDAVQATWNVLEPSVGPMLRTAHHLGVGVLIKEVVANGRLTPKNASNPDFAERYTVLQTHASRLNTTVDALAIAAALARPWADVVLTGAATVAHLESNVKALDVAWDEEATAALDGLLESPQAYWETRSGLAWN